MEKLFLKNMMYKKGKQDNPVNNQEDEDGACFTACNIMIGEISYYRFTDSAGPCKKGMKPKQYSSSQLFS